MPILYDIIEQDITLSGTFTDPFNEVAISVTITRPDSTTFVIGGFFHSVVSGNSLFKFRYMAKAVGTFSWTATKTIAGSTTAAGTPVNHVVTASTANKGHVKLHPTDTKSWVYDNGDPFYPIGYQGSFSPNGGNDDMSTSMDLNDGTTNPGQYVFTNTFLPIYGNGKFNLLRYTVGNNTNDLKIALSPTVLTLSPENGRMGDVLCQRARANGMAVMFVFFNGIGGTSSPAGEGTVDVSAGARANSKKYIKYCVDRYGAYADIWELANEGQGTATTGISDEYLNDIAGEVELRDPYNHAISSSFEHIGNHSYDRDFTKADWFSPHCYLYGTSSLSAHTDILSEISGAAAVNKPLIVGEFGNEFNNYVTNHDTINRIRFWTMWINKAAACVWSQSYNTTYTTGGVANIYVGFGFREFVQKLRNFIDTFPGGTTKSTPTIGTPSSAVQCYALSNSSTHYAAYLISTAQQTNDVTGATIPINIPFAGNAVFTNPKTGAQVGSTVAIVANTATNLAVPAFKEDIALKILSSGGGGSVPPPPDTTAPTVPGVPTFSNITSSAMRASWAASTDDVAVTGYELQYSLNAEFSPKTTIPLGNVLFYDASGLAANTLYYWRVRAHDAVPNNSEYSTTSSQQTSAASVFPLKIDCGTTSGAASGWSNDSYNVLGTDLYTYPSAVAPGLSDDPPNSVLSSVRYSNAATVGYDITGLTTGNSYTVVMWFNTGLGSEVNEQNREFHVDINSTRVLANYKPRVAGDVNYKIKRQSFTAVAANSQIQIRLIALAGYGASVSAISIIPGATSGDTTPPSVPGVATYSNVTQTTKRISWKASTDNAGESGIAGYDLQYSTDPAFPSGSNPVIPLGNVLFYDAAGLTAGTLYYWRTRAKDAAGNFSAYAAASSQKMLTNAPTTGGRVVRTWDGVGDEG